MFVAFTAGFGEEIFFRGFLLERVAAVTGRLWAGVTFSYLVFVAVHLPNLGVAGALRSTAVGALAFTLLYLGTRNVFATGGFHFVLDLGSVF